MNLDRFSVLIGSENLERVKKLNVLLVGVGGVGGYTLESLVRSGVENITIIDGDIIDKTNLNRQIITNNDNIGCKKVVEAKKRALSINEKINIKEMDMFLTEENINFIDFFSYDYIIDACDTVFTKVLLIESAIKNNVKIISSMGTAKRIDASKLIVTTLDKTSNDALARILRKRVNKSIQNKVNVVISTENAKKLGTLGSTSYVPAVAGLLITSYIINDVLR